MRNNRIIKQVFNNININQISDCAATLSFYFSFSLFPGLLVLFSVLNFLPENLLDSQNMWWLNQMPQPVQDLVYKILNETATEHAIPIASLAFLFAFWTASSGMAAVIRQINLTYKFKKTRGFLRLRFVSFVLTFSMGLFAVGPIIFYALLNFIYGKLDLLGSYIALEQFIWFKYVFYMFFLFIGFAFLFYIAPIKKQRLRFIIPGSIFTTILISIITFLFEIYFSLFNTYNHIYGSIGAVMILMFWLYFLGISLLVGAEINHSYKQISS